MNFTNLEDGMTGRDFALAFNGNFDLVRAFAESIATDIAKRLLSNNVKQVKVENGNFYYTLEDVENPSWVLVNTNSWGSMVGDINDQVDLINLFNDYAKASALASLAEIVSGNTSSINTANQAISLNSRSITQLNTALGEIQTKQAKQVSSNDIKMFRIGASGFLEVSLNGTTYMPVQSQADINWGAIGGDIANQLDLINMFNSKVKQSDFNNHVNNEDNPHNVNKEQVGLGNVDNTSDLDKPISNDAAEALLNIQNQIDLLDEGKLQNYAGIVGVQSIPLNDWLDMKSAGTLNDEILYVVES